MQTPEASLLPGDGVLGTHGAPGQGRMHQAQSQGPRLTSPVLEPPAPASGAVRDIQEGRRNGTCPGAAPEMPWGDGQEEWDGAVDGTSPP